MGKKTLPECRYGLSCYRRDPNHWEAYSHPCKYAAACYRKDPDHFVRFTHPKGSTTPRDVATAAAKASVAKHGSDDEDAPGSPPPSSPASSPLDEGEARRRRRKAERKRAATATKDGRDDSDSDTTSDDSDASDAGALAVPGLKVVFTGTFEAGTRRMVEGDAARLGAVVGSSVTSKTDLLVIGGVVRPFGAKEDRANDLGVKIVFEKEWDAMIEAERRKRDAAKKKTKRSKDKAKRRAAGATGAATAATSSSGAGSTSKRAKTDADAEGSGDEDDDADDADARDDNADGIGGEAEDEDGVKLPEPLHKLEDGESVDYTSPSGSVYKIKRTGDHYYCTCPAWRNQSAPVNARTCKHLTAYLGDKHEKARVGHVKAVPLKARGTPKPDLLLAQRWEPHLDPTGWHMSEKLDGVRAYWNGKELLSRLGNAFAAPAWFTDILPRDMTLDGELFMGRGRFNDTVSVVRTVGSKRWSSVTYQVFDCPSEGGKEFEERLDVLQQWHKDQSGSATKHITVVSHARVRDLKHMEEELERVVGTLGGEGLMLRKPKSVYVKTRSSTLLKVKRFYDAEARVIGHAPGKGRHKGVMGALQLEMECGKTFKVGTGFSDAQRRSPPKIGAIITYKFQELTPDGIPRFAAYVGERPDASGPKDFIPKRPTPSDA